MSESQEAPEFPAWTAPDNNGRSGGRDFLGLQSVGDTMLEELLPGLTNTTIHPRYFSFFAWTHVEAERRRLSWKQMEASRFVMESALVYAAYATHEAHYKGIVGSLSVRPGKTNSWVGPSGTYPLGRDEIGYRISAFDPAYYSPSSQKLGLFKISRSEIELHPLAHELATAFRKEASRGASVDLLSEPTTKSLGGRDLQALHADLCPCGLGARGDERQLLCDLLFRLDRVRGPSYEESDSRRRQTLALVLELGACWSNPAKIDRHRSAVVI